MSYDPFIAMPTVLFKPIFTVTDKGNENNWPIQVSFGEGNAAALYLQYSEAITLAHALRVACGAAEPAAIQPDTDPSAEEGHSE